MKLKISKTLFILPLLVIIIAGGFLISLYRNEAPITKGKVEMGVEYKEGLKLYIYLPTNLQEGRSPLVFYLHGGAWITGNKISLNINRINGAINKLRDNGYTIISADYTLARDGKSPFPDCIKDANDALKWILKNTEKYNLDLSDVTFMGESAGSHIAMFLAYQNPSDTLINLTLKPNKLVNIYGPNSLVDLYYQKNLIPIEEAISKLPEGIKKGINLKRNILGFDPNIDSNRTIEFLNKYSPLNYLDSSDPLTYSIHGTADQVVSYIQTMNLEKKLKLLEIENKKLILDSVDHAFIRANKEQKELVQETIFNWIDQNK